MEGELNTDLNIGSLSDDLEITMEDFSNPNSEQSSLTASLDDEQIITSEEDKTPESVAEEEKSKIPELNKPNGSSSPGDLSSLYSSFADHLVKEGVLPSLNLEESKIQNSEQLQAAIKSQIESSKDENQKAYDKAMQDGVSKDSFRSYQKTKNQLDGITSEMITAEDDRSITLRKNIIGQDFLNRGFTQDEARKYAQRSIDLGEDVSDASMAIDRLKSFNQDKYDKSVQDAELEKEKVQGDVKKFIESTPEVLKGLKLSKNIKDKLYDQIIKPTGVSEKGEPVNEYAAAYEKDPIKFQVMQNYLFMVTKGYTDFSKLTNVATTQANKGLDALLKNTNPAFFQNSGEGIGLQDKESSFTLGDGLMID